MYKPRPRILKPQPVEGPGFIYFIQAGFSGPIKIGWSRNVPHRLGNLQNAHFDILHLLAAVPGTGIPEETADGASDEARMHKRFARFRVRGEWFSPEKEVLEYVAMLHKTNRTVPLERAKMEPPTKPMKPSRFSEENDMVWRIEQQRANAIEKARWERGY